MATREKIAATSSVWKEIKSFEDYQRNALELLDSLPKKISPSSTIVTARTPEEYAELRRGLLSNGYIEVEPNRWVYKPDEIKKD